MERWPSGLRRTLGKRVCEQSHRRFKSCSLRHENKLAIRLAYFNDVEQDTNLRLLRSKSTAGFGVVQRNKNVFTYFYEQTKERNEVERYLVLSASERLAGRRLTDYYLYGNILVLSNQKQKMSEILKQTAQTPELVSNKTETDDKYVSDVLIEADDQTVHFDDPDHERIRLELKPEFNKPSSIEGVMNVLIANGNFDPSKCYCEFEISDEISADDIKKLLELPYEVSLTERNGKVILATGTADSTGLEKEYINRSHYSRLSFHTHPTAGEGQVVNTPSFSDIYNTDFASKNTSMVLASHKGIMVYIKPISSKVSDEFLPDARDVMYKYCTSHLYKDGENNEHEIDLFGFRKTGFNWSDVPREDQIKYERQFAEDTGMIVEEASWDDYSPENDAKLKTIMDIVNLKTNHRKLRNSKG